MPSRRSRVGMPTPGTCLPGRPPVRPVHREASRWDQIRGTRAVGSTSAGPPQCAFQAKMVGLRSRPGVPGAPLAGPTLARAKVQRGTDGSLFQICSVLAHVSPERASGRPAKGNALDRDGHEKVVFRANGPTTRLRRPVGPLGRENHPLAFRLPGRCPSLGDGLGLRPARALQFHAEQNCSACSSIQGPIFREFARAGPTYVCPRNPAVRDAVCGSGLFSYNVRRSIYPDKQGVPRCVLFECWSWS